MDVSASKPLTNLGRVNTALAPALNHLPSNAGLKVSNRLIPLGIHAPQLAARRSFSQIRIPCAECRMTSIGSLKAPGRKLLGGKLQGGEWERKTESQAFRHASSWKPGAWWSGTRIRGNSIPLGIFPALPRGFFRLFSDDGHEEKTGRLGRPVGIQHRAGTATRPAGCQSGRS